MHRPLFYGHEQWIDAVKGIYIDREGGGLRPVPFRICKNVTLSDEGKWISHWDYWARIKADFLGRPLPWPEQVQEWEIFENDDANAIVRTLNSLEEWKYSVRIASLSLEELREEYGLWQEHRELWSVNRVVDTQYAPLKILEELILVRIMHALSSIEISKSAGITSLIKGNQLSQSEIRSLIAEGENAKVEFKSTLRWDVTEKRINKILPMEVVVAAASFLNTDGGIILIGIGDKKNVFGLAADFKTFGDRQDKDGFENYLTTLLLDQFGKHLIAFITITFHDLDGKEIALITLKPSLEPVYVKEKQLHELYVRTGNSSRKLDAREIVGYLSNRRVPENVNRPTG